ncbi:MAG TPA: hypothetical protein VJ728_18120 [Candidatus Binataceae bacterium]|nr:hypothetical protein [Candidatus Binataceae bacterium]
MTDIVVTLSVFRTEQGYRAFCGELGLVGEPARRRSAAIESLRHDIFKELHDAAYRGRLLDWLDRNGFVYRADTDEVAVPIVEEQKCAIPLPSKWRSTRLRSAITGEGEK